MKNNNNNDINIWKIGSRWSGQGKTGTCIFDVFKKSKFVFVGKNRENNSDPRESFQQQVKEGDYFCIADGLRLIAVARADSNADYIQNVQHNPNNFKTDIDSAFDYSYEYSAKNMAVCKVEIHDKLNDKEIKDLDFSITKIRCTRGTFYKMHKYRDDVIKLFHKSHS